MSPGIRRGFFVRHARRHQRRASQKRASENIGVLCGPVILGNEARSYEETVMSNIIPFPYQGQAVRFNLDGWINATDVAKRFDKRPVDWLRLPDTKEYLGALAKHLNVGKSHNLIQTARGRSGGTWLHPKLAVHFARWLDADFAVWADLQIDALLRGDVSIRQRYEEACQQLEDRRDLASAQGRGLAQWRWEKRPLEARAEYWRSQLQMSLSLESA